MPEPDQQPPHYQRPVESTTPALRSRHLILPADHNTAIDASTLSDGSKALLRGLMRLGGTATYSGGGVGLDYAGLLKTAVRPDALQPHVKEAAMVLRERQVDLLLVPGMSGFPIGTMYAMRAGIPALLLRKEPWRGEGRERNLPPGAFVLPSYTSAGEVVMTADPVALLDITTSIFRKQLEHQSGSETVRLTLRVAGADDIIDKATMARAVSESAHRLGAFAAHAFQRDWCRRSGDNRSMTVEVDVVTWITPMIKQYNHPEASLSGVVSGSPFAGLRITGIYTAPRAIGIEGVGVLAFGDPEE